MKKILLLFCFAFILVGVHSQGFINLSDPLGFDHTYSLGEYGGGASFVDFNQDGLDDVTTSSGAMDDLYFHLNVGLDFELQSPFIDNDTEVKQVLWVDYDNDGDLDLYVCSKQLNRLYKNTGDLVFEDITETCGFNDPPNQSFNAVWLDYDEDGLLDVCVSHRLGHLIGAITLYHNLGDDQFEDVTLEAGLDGLGNSVLAMTTLDMNNDGLEDIYVGQDYDAGNLMLKNNGDGTFENISNSSGTEAINNTMSTTIGDYNNDGWMDIYVTNTSEGNSFYVNQGDETFIEQSIAKGIQLQQFTWGAVFLDADNDMDLDLYIDGIISSWATNSRMFENPGDDSQFIEVNDIWGMEDEENSSIGNCIGDYNGDGFPDIFKINNGENHTMWLNQFTENNFLTVDLNGVISNSMAVGSVIEVAIGNTHQYRRIGCGEGFSSQNSYTQFFGLGDNEVIDSLIVNWPNGLVTTLYDVDANQHLNLIEVQNTGCTDLLACNFDSEAEISDGSCEFAMEFLDCDGMCLSDIDGDLICDEFEIPGCTDLLACNYESLATDSDTSCIYPETYYDCEGNCLFDIDEDGVCDELEISGCQEEFACNYDPEATDEDGSCYYVDSLEIEGLIHPWFNTEYTYTYPEGIGSTYEWAITNGMIQSGQGSSEVVVIWATSGEGTLLVKETDIFGCEGNWVEFEVDVTITSINQFSNFNVLIYPNPVKDVLTLEFSDNSVFPKTLEIRNSIGQVVLSELLVSSKLLLDVGGLATGVYVVSLDGVVVEKLVVE